MRQVQKERRGGLSERKEAQSPARRQENGCPTGKRGVTGVASTDEDVADGHRHKQRGVSQAMPSSREETRVAFHIRQEKIAGDGEHPGAAGVLQVRSDQSHSRGGGSGDGEEGVAETPPRKSKEKNRPPGISSVCPVDAVARPLRLPSG